MPANFKLRLLASLNDAQLLFLPHSLFWLYLSGSSSLSNLAYNISLYLILIVFPIFLFSSLFYHPWLTSHLGGTLGKLLTGLKITDENEKILTYKRSFFRATTGYGFSGLFFGLGFLSIVKDPQKLGWHDKAVGSKVLVIKKLWPYALVIFFILVGINGFLISRAVTKIFLGPVKNEVQTLILNSKKVNKNDNLILKDQISVEFYNLQSEVYRLLEKKDYQKAEQKAKLLQNSSKNDLEKATAYRVLGEISSALGNDGEARDYWLESLKLNPDDEYTNFQLAHLEFVQKNYQQALTYAQKAVDLNANSASYHNLLANILYGLYKDDQALKEINEAIRLEPNNPVYKDNLKIIQSNTTQ